MIPAELTPYLNLLLNIVTLVVVTALAVWLRRSHVQVVELKGQLLGMIMSLRIMVNGQDRGARNTPAGEKPHDGPTDPHP